MGKLRKMFKCLVTVLFSTIFQFQRSRVEDGPEGVGHGALSMLIVHCVLCNVNSLTQTTFLEPTLINNTIKVVIRAFAHDFVFIRYIYLSVNDIYNNKITFIVINPSVKGHSINYCFFKKILSARGSFFSYLKEGK